MGVIVGEQALAARAHDTGLAEQPRVDALEVRLVAALLDRAGLLQPPAEDLPIREPALPRAGSFANRGTLPQSVASGTGGTPDPQPHRV